MASCSIAPSPLSAYEQQRLDRIAENRKRMEDMGVLDTARDLIKTLKPARPPLPARRAPKVRRQKVRRQPMRRSRRLTGAGAEFEELRDEETVTYDEYEPSGLDDILADGGDIAELPAPKQEAFQELRCNSTGRGSVYDSVAGITCHFCRQKKLCGEEGCPRCSRRSTTAECIGKSDCARCHGATGRFCRACLLIRYGQTLEEVRAQMADGSWLCPHCYEEEHPEEGWMCNSSICMKRRGYKPTGIAIYDAQQRGFPSVAHWLQAQLRKRGGGGGSSSEAAATAAAAVLDSCSEGDGAVRTPSKAAGKAKASAAASSEGGCASEVADGSAAVEAPITPGRSCEVAVTSSAAAAAGGAGVAAARVTRAGAKAAAVAAACGAGAKAAKRAAGEDAAAARRSQRVRGSK